MPLEKLIDRIMREAREHSEQIKEEARRSRSEILDKAGSESDELYHRLVEETRRAAWEEKQHTITEATLKARRRVLEEKQSLIREAVERSLKRVQQMSEEEYARMLTGQILELVDERDAELLLSSRDAGRVGKTVVDSVNASLEGAGRAGRITLSGETRDIAGGFVLREEGVEVNNSLEALIESRWADLEPRLVKILFGGE